jgi:3-hydroxymyristoyl/3-hydroxydecanoyl-(acyl carrier protein) dehydratase
VVPGVVLLEQIVRRAGEWLGEERWLRALPVVKFTAPLAPGETFQVKLEQGADGALRFRVERGQTLIAWGSMALAEPRRP